MAAGVGARLRLQGAGVDRKSRAIINQQPGETSRDTESRRDSPRLEVLRRVGGRALTHDISVELLNMSRGGFLMQAPVDFPVGTVDTFGFTTRAGKSVVLCAKVMHTLRVSAGDRASFYAVGLQFVAEGDEAEQAIRDLISTLEVSRP